MKIDIPAIVEGYSQGYFLMCEDDELNWYSSRPAYLNSFRRSLFVIRNLYKEYSTKSVFSIAINRDFEAVLRRLRRSR